AALEQAGQLLRRPFEHRPDQGSDHVPEKAVGGELELQGVASAMPDRAFDHPGEHFVLRLRGRESPEVMLAEQQIHRLGKALLVERPRIPPAAIRLERRWPTPPVDAVPIAPRRAGTPSVEARLTRFYRRQRQVAR